MIQLQEKIITNHWSKADWETYINAIEAPERIKNRGYYYDGYMRIEDMPTGADHSRYHLIIAFAINLFCTIKGIPFNGLDNCTYRQTGSKDCQPDLSYYTQDRSPLAPTGKSVVDLEIHAAPDLVIEISHTTLEDDLGAKRLLYEDMGIPEYWVVDVEENQIYAFTISDRGSKRIDNSLVLPQLFISLLINALKHSQELDQAKIGQWLMGEFQKY
jgi:Uma2 family endonuclease